MYITVSFYASLCVFACICLYDDAYLQHKQHNQNVHQKRD